MGRSVCNATIQKSFLFPELIRASRRGGTAASWRSTGSPTAYTSISGSYFVFPGEDSTSRCNSEVTSPRIRPRATCCTYEDVFLCSDFAKRVAQLLCDKVDFTNNKHRTSARRSCHLFVNNNSTIICFAREGILPTESRFVSVAFWYSDCPCNFSICLIKKKERWFCSTAGWKYSSKNIYRRYEFAEREKRIARCTE